MRLFRTSSAVGSWILMLGWMALIYFVSDQSRPDEVAASRGLFGPIPRWLWQWAYHAVAFGTLAALAYAALRLSLPRARRAAVVLALAIGVGYGALDEWHQSFVPGRSPDLLDVATDASGAIVVAIGVGAVESMVTKWARARRGGRLRRQE